MQDKKLFTPDLAKSLQGHPFVRYRIPKIVQLRISLSVWLLPMGHRTAYPPTATMIKCRERISVSLFDGIEIHVEIPWVNDEKLNEARIDAARAAVRQRGKVRVIERNLHLALLASLAGER